MLSRRRFLRGVTGGVAAAGAAAVYGRASLDAVAQAAAAGGPDAAFWQTVQGEYMLDRHWAYMNNGTLGPTPKPVYYAMLERYRDLAEEPGPFNSAQGEAAEEVRKKAAAFVGATPDEIALTRNTTEGMSFIANGLDLKAGDEVLMSFHEHPGGREPWRLKARRHGIVIKEVAFPLPPPDPATLTTMFVDQITPRTRVISVSHIMYQTGSALPVKALAAIARSRGILTVVDGAHPLGMLQLDMHDLGVDYYAMSPHKWLDAPTGTGLLYMRRESQDQVWPTVATTGWNDEKRAAARFDRLSQRAWPLVLATGAAIDFQNAIGRDRVEARVRALQSRLREKVAAIPGVKIYTSEDPAMCGALLSFAIEGLKNDDIVETLKQRHQIWIRTVDWDLNAVRVSTHVYNDEAQVDRLVEGLHGALRDGVVKAPTASQ